MPLTSGTSANVPATEPKAIEAPTKPPRVLTLLDRCDACTVAAAWVRAYFISGQELDFCSHHWNLYYPMFRDTISDFVDEREYINAKLDVSA